MRVFVKNMRGEALMPTTPRKARFLIKAGKARVYMYTPYVIQLKYATGECVQKCTVNGDPGARFHGIACTSGNKVLAMGTVESRTDIKALLETRKTYRRGRRQRNTRYREARFDNRKRPEGWLPPSLKSRSDGFIRWMEIFRDLLPNPKVTVEIARFDIQKLQDPEISGVDYQQGAAYGFENVRAYVFCRDNYTCRICKGKSKDKRLVQHHIISRANGGSDRADNLSTVCGKCHEEHHGGLIEHVFDKPQAYKEPALMNAIRGYIQKKLNCEVTYGHITKAVRESLGLRKTHYNDAVAISGIQQITEMPKRPFFLRQVRIKKRSLHESTPRKGRTVKNTKACRNSKNTRSRHGFYQTSARILPFL